MPFYTDYYAYGPTPVFSPTHYSALLYLGSGSSSYSSRLGVYIPSTTRSPLPSTPRLFPPPISRRPRRFAPPSLDTISESSVSPILTSSPRLRSRYIAPRPIHIDTADIDVTSPRNRGPFDRSSDGTGDRKGSPKERAGTIRRGRTVVRLHTKRLKDGPPPSAAFAKTAGEKLVEKFYIHESPSRESPTKQEKTADGSKRDCLDSSTVDLKSEDVAAKKLKRSKKESLKTEKLKHRTVNDSSEADVKRVENYETETTLAEVEICNINKSSRVKKSTKERKHKGEEIPSNATFKAKEHKDTFPESRAEEINVSIVEGFDGHKKPEFRRTPSIRKPKDIRPRLIVGEVSIEVHHAPVVLKSKKPKRLRMQVEVVVDGEESFGTAEEKVVEPMAILSKSSTPAKKTTPVHSVPSSPLPIPTASEESPISKGVDKLKSREEEQARVTVGSSTNSKEQKMKEGVEAMTFTSASQSIGVIAKEKDSGEVMEEKSTGKPKEARGKKIKQPVLIPSQQTTASNAPSEDISSKKGAVSALQRHGDDKKVLAGGTQARAKLSADAQKSSSANSSNEPETTSPIKTESAVKCNAIREVEKDACLDNVAVFSKDKLATDAVKELQANITKDSSVATISTEKKDIIKKVKLEVVPYPLELQWKSISEKMVQSPVSPVVEDRKTTVEKQKSNKITITTATINENKKTDIPEKAKILKDAIDPVSAEKTKYSLAFIQNKEKIAAQPTSLLTRKEETIDQKKMKKPISSNEAEIPLKNIALPQKGSSPKVVEKVSGSHEELLKAGKVAPTEESDAKLGENKIKETENTMKIKPKAVPEESVVKIQPEPTKVDERKSEPKPPVLPDSPNISNQRITQVSHDSLTKHKTQAECKNLGIKTDFEKVTESETTVAKTKPQLAISKIPQELRKIGNSVPTSLKAETCNEGDSDRMKDNSLSTASSKLEITSSKGISLAEVTEGKLDSSLPYDKNLKKADNKTGAEARKESGLQGKGKKTDDISKDALIARKITPIEDKEENSQKSAIVGRVEVVKETDTKAEYLVQKKEMEKTVDIVTKLTDQVDSPLVLSEENDEETDSGEDSSEEADETDETDSEETTETDSEEEEERRLVEEAIRRASVPGTSAAPARTLPRFRDYNLKDFLFLRVLGKGSFGKVCYSVYVH